MRWPWSGYGQALDATEQTMLELRRLLATLRDELAQTQRERKERTNGHPASG